MATWRSQLAKGMWAVGGGSFAALLVFALWTGTRGMRETWLVEQLRAAIVAAPDDQVEPLVRQATALGERAMPLLAESLGSYRTSLAVAAHAVLTEELESWAELPSDEAARRAYRLAAALADYVPLYGSTGRGWAAEIVERLIRWPLPREGGDRDAMLLHCSTVLQTTAEMRGRADWSARQAAAQLDPSRTATRPPNLSPEADTVLARLLEGIDLPGGGLPTQPARVQSIPAEPIGASPQSTPPRERRPEPLVLPDASPLAEEPGRLEPKQEAISDPLVEPVAGNQGAVVQQVRLPSEEEIERLETLPLIHLLRGSQPETLQCVEAELRSRGMHDRHLQLAYRLATPDPEARRQLAEELPKLAGIDPQPWLLWLLEDQEADVRYAAFTILATASDLHLRARLIQLGRQDSDPKIRALAEKLSGERR